MSKRASKKGPAFFVRAAPLFLLIRLRLGMSLEDGRELGNGVLLFQ
jgi:hypothetical protein